MKKVLLVLGMVALTFSMNAQIYEFKYPYNNKLQITLSENTLEWKTQRSTTNYEVILADSTNTTDTYDVVDSTATIKRRFYFVHGKHGSITLQTRGDFEGDNGERFMRIKKVTQLN